MTDLRQAAQQALEALIDAANVLSAPMFAEAVASLRTALEQQAEPGTREGFNAWWDGDYDDSENRFEQDSAAYWAWAGWQAAQREWVGLTDEDVNRESAMIAQQMKLAFHAGMYVAQKILKEKNDH
jgi:hypothetical protein